MHLNLVRPDFGFLTHIRFDFSANLRQYFRRGIVGDTQVDAKEDPITRTERLNAFFRQFAVGNANNRAFLGAKAGGAQTNTFNRAFKRTDPHEITHTERFISRERNTAKQMLNRFLSG